MSIAVDMHVSADANAQAQALAQAVAERLRAAMAERGTATLALPGGETPREFLRALARHKIDWPHVTVVPTDERQVPADDPRSNARALREFLIATTDARFVPLYPAGHDLSATIAALRPFDAVVLGMGADGHCASLFADGDNIAAALRADTSDSIMTLRSPSAPEARTTLTLAALADTRALFVLIRGEEKRRTLDAALRGDAPFAHAPIRAVLQNAAIVPQIHWCV